MFHPQHPAFRRDSICRLLPKTIANNASRLDLMQKSEPRNGTLRWLLLFALIH